MAYRGEGIGREAGGGAVALPRWAASLIAFATLMLTGFVALPAFYVWLIRTTLPTGVLTHDQELHILFNSLTNMLALAAAWGAAGRFDRRLAQLINIVLVAHGVLALIIISTHAYYSNRIMLVSAGASMVLGLLVIVVSRRLESVRIALIGPWHHVAGQIGFPIDYVEDPAEDLRRFDLVLTTFTGPLPPEWAHAISRAMLVGKPVRHAAEYLEETKGLVSIEHFDVEHLPEGGLASYRLGKRVLDILLVVVVAPVAIPLLGIAALAILALMGRPIFFVQPRVGFGGKVFQMVKLRTMRSLPAGEEIATVQGDARVTRLGGLLRRFRIDEIPQLWQVAVGEMSFIGPRPEQPALTEAYIRQAPAFAYRQLVRPGITGWAQVRAGYAANLEETKVKLGYDLFYLKYFSLALDLQILLRTILTLLTGRGVR